MEVNMYSHQSIRHPVHRLRLATIGLVSIFLPALAAAAEAPTEVFVGRWTLMSVTGDVSDRMARAVEGRPTPAPGTTIAIDASSGALTARRAETGTPFRILAVTETDARQEIPDGGILTAHVSLDGREIAVVGRLAVRQGLLTRTVPFDERWRVDAAGRRLDVVLTLRTPMGVKQRTLTFERPLFFDRK
jgi:hypothetical protein